MITKVIRIFIGIMVSFIALTAVGGGIALLSGAEAQRVPLAWLAGTPFRDYTVPALILIFGVGGSSLAALLFLLKRNRWALPAALLAGLVLMGFIGVEVLILKQVPPGPTPIEIMYLLLGLAIFILAARLRMAGR